MIADLAAVEAIDPEAAYHRWVERFLWHVDQLPSVVETTGTIAVAARGVHAAPLRERVSGGGYIDNIPLVDGPEARSGRAVWSALRGYLVVASSRLGVEAPQIPAGLPDDVELARQWAYAANEWLAAVVHEIRDWPDLAELEEALFRLIRRARGRVDPHTARRARPELCRTCGEAAVLVDWIDGPDGAAELAKACKVCGQTYTDTGNENRSE
ncbi:MAG TPA: hypothetical protein VIP82_20895 [Microbacterium sp.]|uniref:hypothetical protein n=1 Tax=Microbacterium sp. TaxID=51671 RepID=UPI002F957048